MKAIVRETRKTNAGIDWRSLADCCIVQRRDDDKLHRETTDTTTLLQEREFSKVVNRRVDPATTL
jgi:hypothetical protein